MTIEKYSWYVIPIIVVILIVTYLSTGDLPTVYAQEIISPNSVNVDSYYVTRNTRKLFGFIILGLTIFGAIKGWRKAVVLGCFLVFLGLASIGLFAYGKLIAPWMTSADSKFIPAVVFIVGGFIIINLLHKIFKLMNEFLKNHLY